MTEAKREARRARRRLQKAVAVDSKVPEGYEWLARAYDRNRQPKAFFSAWAKALNVDPWASDRNVWPVFCVTIQHPSIEDTPTTNDVKYENKVDSQPITNDIKKDITLQKTHKISENKVKFKFLKLIFVFIISFTALIILVDTFKYPISKVIPNIEFILYNLYETVKDIKLFLYDLI